jgi:hypothetical protein
MNQTWTLEDLHLGKHAITSHSMLGALKFSKMLKFLEIIFLKENIFCKGKY